MTVPDPVPGLEAGDRARLVAVLQRARDMGFIGPRPIEDQIDRSLALVPALTRSLVDSAPTCGSPERICGVTVRALDLGSGAGLPGLVLAMALPDWEWTLLDGSVKRTAALVEALDTLGLRPRTVVASQRAEEAGRGALRGSFDLVVARGFAAAAPTAECAAPFLRVGGAAIVTEPPGGAPWRWPTAGLAPLGMITASSIVEPVAVQVLRQTSACPSRYPRRTGIPVKRPLWTKAGPSQSA